jgi:negative regulator of replication initiation
MPNRPRPDNPARTIRVDDTLWSAFKKQAQAEDQSASERLRRLMANDLKRRS